MASLWGPGHLLEPKPELEPDGNWSWSLSHSCSLGLGGSLRLGLWPAEPETFVDVGTSTFSKLGVSDIGKPTELAVATLWDLGLDLLRLYEDLP